MSDFSNPSTQPIYVPNAPATPPAEPPDAVANRKLKTVAILNIISAVLSFGWTLLMLFYAVLAALTNSFVQNASSAPPPPRALMVAIFAVFALFCVLAGSVQLIAGLKLLKRRPNMRTWAIVASVANFLCVFLFCCLPYYLFVAIYTLVVLSRHDFKDFPPSPPARRPISVTVTAILSIVYGVVGILGLFLMLAQWAGAFPVNPYSAYFDVPVWRVWIGANANLGIVLFPFLIFVGRNLLRLKPWARTAFFALAAIDILRQLVGLALIPSLYSYVSLPPEMPAMKPVIFVSMLLGPLFVISVLVTFIILMSRPKVRDAFAQSPPTP